MANIDLGQLAQSAAYAARGVRELGAQFQKQAQEFAALRDLVTRTAAMRSGDPGIQRVENIPGRRVPFDLLVDIPIAAGATGVQPGTITIDQSGPFVAVARMASLMSVYEFTHTTPGTTTTNRYFGRSYGRYRPIHSAWDLNDGQPVAMVSLAGPPAFPGSGAPHIISPSNASSFRSMEGDFRIKFENAGSGFPRSNQEVPSSFWTKSINEPWELGALDFFERGEVLNFRVLPLHANNGAFGNLSGYSLIDPNFPFQESQWDAVEGVNDQAVALSDETDPIVRVPNAILTIGFHGYKIIQQPGAVC